MLFWSCKDGFLHNGRLATSPGQEGFLLVHSAVGRSPRRGAPECRQSLLYWEAIRRTRKSPSSDTGIPVIVAFHSLLDEKTTYNGLYRE